MSFTPQNVSVYLAANAGALAGIGAAGKQQLSRASVSGNFNYAALMADAFAQEVDVQWQAIVGAPPSSYELSAILTVSEGIWETFSPLPAPAAYSAGSYYAIALNVVNLTIEGAAQVAAEGINPNTPVTVAYTSATVVGGQTYTVKPTDTMIVMDSSNGNAPIATLSATGYIGEEHTFFWFAWNVSQTPPIINVAGGALKLSPVPGMTTSGAAGLLSQTHLNQTGSFITYKWTGTAWLQSG